MGHSSELKVITYLNMYPIFYEPSFINHKLPWDQSHEHFNHNCSDYLNPHAIISNKNEEMFKCTKCGIVITEKHPK